MVTDRLHAHLLCTWMGIPHVVLDNTYGKIERFRGAWQTGGETVRQAASLDEAEQLAAALLADLDGRSGHQNDLLAGNPT